MRINHILPGKKIVWVNDDRMYLKGKDYKILKKETWESSLYASVYKYSHDVFPAKAGLGTNGCTDCHSFSSDLFYRQIVKYPFGDLTEPQFKRLNMSGFMIGLSAFREQFVKSFEYPAIIFLILAIISGILMMIKFELIYQIVRVAYTVFDISVVLSVVISIIYLIIDQFAILKTDVQK